MSGTGQPVPIFADIYHQGAKSKAFGFEGPVRTDIHPMFNWLLRKSGQQLPKASSVIAALSLSVIGSVIACRS